MVDDDDRWNTVSAVAGDDEPAPGLGAMAGGADGSGDGPSEADETELDGESSAEDGGGNVAGHLGGLDDRLEPGSPTLENTLFVLVGALGTLLLFLRMAGVV
jgi:hypothetical protein